MSYLSYKVRVPGKLMIAGEYAVLEPNQKSVVIAVDRYVTAYIEPSKQNKISLPKLGLEDIAWEINEEKVRFSIADPRLNFIENSISVVNQFLEEKSIEIIPFKLQIKSELDDPLTGTKYGLGSSAAVVVAAISAMLALHSDGKEQPSLYQIFKLSAIAHLKSQKSGSGADIAAAVYGGWLEYSAFMGKWVLSQLDEGTKLTEIVQRDWPNLSIRKLTPPTSIKLAVGWTKSAVATAPMIKNIQSFREHNLDAYNQFLMESSIGVERIIKGFEMNDCEEAIIGLKQNRKALQKLGERAGVDIETEKLKALCTIAEEYGSGKSSGAGGGDCGIAFLKDDSYVKALYEGWKDIGISPLDLKVSQVGVLSRINDTGLGL
ncbi:phosphomevalonate kinase [Clostridium folliculivorans]|uniref:phosphomevalonate kinase n=1 Tax=Clostridium folliculivorans TaxID=2886038 RepID=A0A9W5XZG3_9CLOT|nr:phosphomevalonate kinase [Clostridium folliculivorans]GKU23750.1 phosphomevalonate kinase [Clostridium folliculivorans]GKU29866.1 phosphomevalonate kinase [Clostridium folliculivorans]